MINELKNIELAKAFNIPSAKVAMWLKRNQIVKNDRGFIDISNPINKIWLDKKIAEGLEMDFNRINEKIAPPERVDKKEKEIKPTNGKGSTSQKIAEIADLQKKKARLEIKNLQNKDKLDKLKIEKMEGALIPTDAVIHLIAHIVPTVTAQHKQNIDKILNLLKQRLDIGNKIYVELQKELYNTANDLNAEIKQELINSIDNIVDDYREVRGRGERK